MTNAQTNTLVFKDQAGEYYLLPLDAMERARVPAEHRAEVERLLADRGDVQGYLAPIAFLFIGMAMEAGAIGFGYMVTDIAMNVSASSTATAPTLDLSASASPETVR